MELVYCDFESAAIIAAGNIFPQARVQGCFFHLCQAVYRKLCKLGFQTRYGTDEDFAVLVSSDIRLRGIITILMNIFKFVRNRR